MIWSVQMDNYYNRILFNNESHAKECDVDVIKWISSSMLMIIMLLIYNKICYMKWKLSIKFECFSICYIVHKLEIPVNRLLYIFHTQFIPPGKTELVRIWL